ncbi:hypothetical protein CPB84DRAFT_1775476 [Gymnopilus junonius]|uniref:BTB domain-containing protein n=1 Tax=Gymnopilus junonius TaxID=109634 RepID=A0A9P5TNH6_GYMJU|nr:hypothetical protein CPB84DRAFT_1775476 [Gymnopilus junonius]
MDTLKKDEVQRFKVHHTLLSRHSRFFSTIPKGNKKINGALQEQGDGTSISSNSNALNRVVLDADRQAKASDVEALLRHLYHDVPLNKDASLDHIMSLLRVSGPQQLDFPTIYNAARQIFEDMFPKDPEAFTHNHPLHDALPVATALKLSSVRKAILYSLVSTTEFDVSGSISGDMDPQREVTLTASNGETSAGRQEDPTDSIVDRTEPPASPQTALPLRALSPANIETCMALMNHLIAHFTPILFTPAATPHMACTDVFAETWMPLVIQPALEDDGVYKPLETLQRMKEIDWAHHGLCQSCIVGKREEWTDEQRTVWNLMDTWLEPPSEIEKD